jgi:hypothetical protein
MRSTGEGGENPWLQPSANTAFVRAFLQVTSSLKSVDHAAHHMQQMSLTHQIATDVAREIRQKAETESQMLIAQATMGMCSSACSAAFFAPPKTADEHLPKFTRISTEFGAVGGVASSSGSLFTHQNAELDAHKQMLETLDSITKRTLEAAASEVSSSGHAFDRTAQQVTQVMESAQMASPIVRG